MNKAELVIIRGVPGSGKTKIAMAMLSHLHFEADQYFIDEKGGYNFDKSKLSDAHYHCLRCVKFALDKGSRVVVSNTFIKAWELDPYFEKCRELGIIPTIIEAKGSFKSVHNVPDDVIDRMKANYEQVEF